MILHSKILRMEGGGRFHSRNPQAKVHCDGGGGGGGESYNITHPTRTERLYSSNLVFYVNPDGSVEVAKDRYNAHTGEVNIEELITLVSKMIADLKLKDTKLEMFKEGLSELLQESITNTLKGEHYERTIRSKSAGHGSESNWST